jgi:hypothetical protein
MYQWIVYLHVVGAFGLMFAHGASALVAFRLRREREVERIRALLDLSSLALRGMWGSLLLLLVAGIVAGFMGGWWGDYWIWISLVLLILIVVGMALVSTRSYYPLRTAVGLPDPWTKLEGAPQPPAPPEEIEHFIVAGRPFELLTLGFGGTLIILWFMMFKPF